MRDNAATTAIPHTRSSASSWLLPALLTLVLLALQGGADAQGGAVSGTQIVLPDGSRCVALHDSESVTVAGAELEYRCGEGGYLGLVGGVIESKNQLSLEVVEVGGAEAGVEASRLAIFPVDSLVLENGTVCTPNTEIIVQGAEEAAPYSCVAQDGSTLVVVADMEQGSQDGYATSFANVAELGADGQVVATERLAVRVIDGTMPFTKVRWVLSSWGTGQAPPIEGSAPTLEFQEGRASGTSGCNSYFTAATILSEGQMELGPVGSTLMACSEELMQQEFRYFAALDGVIGYEYFGGNLYLYGGAEVITFSPAADQ